MLSTTPSQGRSEAMRKTGAFRFLYLNAYSFLLLFAALAVLALPLFRLHPLFLMAQIAAALPCLYVSAKLFSVWSDKKRKYALLRGKNKNGFREESFGVFMQAPCGRLLVRAVLRDLGMREKYAVLRKYRKSFREELRQNCRPVKTAVYIREDS